MGLFRGRREEPIEELSTEALCARVGLTPPRPAKADVPTAQRPDYLRMDGPRPVEPRTWRAGVSGSR